MKHGPIAMIDEKTPTVVVIPSDAMYEKTFSNLEVVNARKGPIIAIATEGNDAIRRVANDVIFVPATLEPLFPLLASSRCSCSPITSPWPAAATWTNPATWPRA